MPYLPVDMVFRFFPRWTRDKVRRLQVLGDFRRLCHCRCCPFLVLADSQLACILDKA